MLCWGEKSAESLAKASKVLPEVLEEKKAFLEEVKMWPMPAHKPTAQWIEEVEHATTAKELTPAQRLALLQNEYIYRKQIKDAPNLKQLEVAIQKGGGKVLASLDLKDRPEPAAVAQAALPPGLIPVMHDDPRVPPAFAALGAGGQPGSMYQIGDLILSDAPDGEKNHADAIAFCAGLGGGARLPTDQEWRDVIRPVLSPGGRYNLRLIPNMECPMVLVVFGVRCLQRRVLRWQQWLCRQLPSQW